MKNAIQHYAELEKQAHDYYEACIQLMDEEIREKLHSACPDNENDFLFQYCKAHFEKYNEEFIVN